MWQDTDNLYDLQEWPTHAGKGGNCMRSQNSCSVRHQLFKWFGKKYPLPAVSEDVHRGSIAACQLDETIQITPSFDPYKQPSEYRNSCKRRQYEEMEFR